MGIAWDEMIFDTGILRNVVSRHINYHEHLRMVRVVYVWPWRKRAPEILRA